MNEISGKESELLRRTVEDLKEVPFNKWEYYIDDRAPCFGYRLKYMHVCITCRGKNADYPGSFRMIVQDSEDAVRSHNLRGSYIAGYEGEEVRSLYEHLEVQRLGNFPQTKAEKRSVEISLLEKLMKKLERK